MSFVIVFIILTGSLVVHVLVHRALLLVNKRTMAVNAVYFLGLGAMVVCWRLGFIKLPITSIFLFCTVSIFFSYFYMATFLEGETPASVILESFKTRKRQTYRQLLNLFSDRGLIWQRIDDLKHTGLISRRNGRYRLTTKGKRIEQAIGVYETIFHRRIRG